MNVTAIDCFSYDPVSVALLTEKNAEYIWLRLNIIDEHIFYLLNNWVKRSSILLERFYFREVLKKS